jgi:hypothetical protein
MGREAALKPDDPEYQVDLGAASQPIGDKSPRHKKPPQCGEQTVSIYKKALSVGRVDRQHLSWLEGLAHAWVPALEMLHLDVEALGYDVQ